ncbi:argininosuccinate lyase [Sphaeroforma arctica JP610]|uniref:Argininosuccinate lyase n=1 Tax=Sphaeroforma arctica JP610 TaxID=667725 RepID=A0A0L0G0W2_9EUKA|nr:argininosuccinate lyase [Sphaeroforma arctica JP610]KNC82484.1 argininosuccinate lyase [Sphaeroforma arctica JP610]|eukprot:XP_014156386.1 argininosuccinate lyase [Sphaeroforma arctica JP610]
MTQPKQTETKLWGGRFTGAQDPVMEEFNASIRFDKRMYKQDIEGSIVYAKAIAKAGLITDAESETLQKGLQDVLEEWKAGSFVIKSGDEDIHTANERRLKEMVGDVAGKLHTGRSRNDQVATDMRLWLREEAATIRKYLVSLISVHLNRAQQEVDALMPGYTHLQRAQPIRWSHWVCSYASQLTHDLEALDSLIHRFNECPLGSGALAGNPFGVDRQFIAQELGFRGPTANSLEATRSRDFITEFLFWSSLVASHLSGWAEDLIIYSTKEFGFISVADAYSTGSSLMPQKRNADSLELIRGKSGRVFGQLAGFMMTMKGLPSTYNKDMQEDKEALFNVTDTLESLLQIAEGVMSTLTIDEVKMKSALAIEMLSTDVAYYLVRKGVPFREAHGLAGEVVRMAEDKKCEMDGLTKEDMRTVSKHFGDDVTSLWDFENSVEQYQAQGGTSKSSVLGQIESLRKELGSETS